MLGLMIGRFLISVHGYLKILGRGIGQFVVIAIVLILFLGPIFAVILASLIGGAVVANLLGAGTWLILTMFWVFVMLIGVYVAPNVQPQISRALSQMLSGPEEE